MIGGIVLLFIGIFGTSALLCAIGLFTEKDIIVKIGILSMLLLGLFVTVALIVAGVMALRGIG